MRCLPLWPLLLLCACGGEAEIQLNIVPPLHAEVGAELSMPLHAYAGGAPIEWSWRSLTNERLAMRRRRPTLATYTGGTAVFRWTPLSEDFGQQNIEFTASGGGGRKSEVVSFTIEEGGAPPVFREPVGEGTILDPVTTPCARIRITVESTISSEVELGVMGEIENLEIVQTQPLSGELSFCPSAAQRLAERVYPITLTADGGSHVVSKVYVIVLLR